MNSLQAYADLVAACGSAKPSNALPALLRAQTAAASLASGLTVLSNFLVVAVKPLDRPAEQAGAQTAASQTATAVAQREETPAPPQAERIEQEAAWPEPSEQVRATTEEIPAQTDHLFIQKNYHSKRGTAHQAETVSAPLAESVAPERARCPEPEPVFDLSSFPAEIQDLHRRANRVAKVAMQDIKLLRPKDVQLGREHKDICDRLRSDLDKARKEYDRRFRAIQDHPVDYFH